MARPYSITRNPQPDGVDYLLVPRDDEDIPLRAEKLIWSTGGLILLAMVGSWVAASSNALHRFGMVSGFPWIAVVLIVGTLIAALFLQAWVFDLDDGEMRVALRHHHVTVDADTISLVSIEEVIAEGDGITLRLKDRVVELPVCRGDLLRELRAAVAGAQPAEPPEALRRLREKA